MGKRFFTGIRIRRISNGKVVKQKIGSFGMPQKGQKQVADHQRNALTSLVNFVV